MLIQFRVKNHRSLRDEQTLSMVAEDNKDEHFGFLSSAALQEKLLPAAAIYGANASGKSNVLHAFALGLEAVTSSHSEWFRPGARRIEPFKLGHEVGAASAFAFDFVANDVRYAYRFALDQERVREEELQAWPRGRVQTWYRRKGDEFRFGKSLRGENETIRKLTREDSLFLSAAAQNGHKMLMPVYRWFQRVERSPDEDAARSTKSPVLDMFPNPFRELTLRELASERREDVLKLLQAADLGIEDIRLAPSPNPRYPEITLQLRHRGSRSEHAWFEMDQESNGTQKLLWHARPLLRTLQWGGIAYVDELEASLHPALAVEILRLFQDPRRNPGRGQLIFTTHDTNLLGRMNDDRAVLRRDQIWLTEKDVSGATSLYPLTDFKPRKEENLERGYLQGRYGAVPYLGEFPGFSVRDADPNSRKPSRRARAAKR